MKIPLPNYTQIPNVLLDCMYDFTHTEFKVLMFICRKTFGFHKEKHLMSWSYLEQGCGLSRDTAGNALKTLEAKGVVVKSPANSSFEYAINLELVQHVGKVVGNSDCQLVGNSDQTGGKFRPVAVGNSDTKKETSKESFKEISFASERDTLEAKKSQARNELNLFIARQTT